jgi:sulfur carrier protein ThiS
MSRPSQSESAPVQHGAVTVSVTFFSGLRRFLPRGAEGPQRYTLPAGATVADLLAAIGIDPGADITAAVDGELASRDVRLRHGADVMLLYPMEGGAGAAAVRDAAGSGTGAA